MATQKDIAQFLNNTENAQRLNDLVDDICVAVMEYQVRILQALALVVHNIRLRLPYNKASTTVPVS